ncbi:phage Gp37/Gp68 family protein [Methylocucumis oryzae]|uniref:Phage protein Gp37/Gp68 n=1 Tax=Methylocucumis oryzae TaxID=1632867 RepID=A0A0F3IQV9_9GAMM|nr:phage Gp37/Gp68 family protein [Methylocucumis oryzae]KJV07994.1 hypothetical protein VZ94_00820 [Methylocucumis oryzae]
MKNSKIQWCDHTFNPWLGCTKVSPACDNCYAESWAKRTGQSGLWQGERKKTSDNYWRQPYKWHDFLNRNNNAWEMFKYAHDLTDEELIARGFIPPHRERVFCASLADVFDNKAQDEWRQELFAVIEDCYSLDWLLLTKRIGNAKRMLPDNWRDGYHNAWLGITICNQKEADRDIPKLLSIPAKIRFLSIEPMLGPINLNMFDGIDWVIVGGESGNNARPMPLKWVRSIRDQCIEKGIPFFFKQWGEWIPINQEACPDCTIGKRHYIPLGDCVMYKIGKKKTGNILDGEEWAQFPIVKS